MRYGQFDEIWGVDSEWGFRSRRIDFESAFVPVIICFTGLLAGGRVHFWGADPMIKDFIAGHGGDLFVAHAAIAEMKYLARQRCPLPKHWYDTFAAERYVTNAPGVLDAGLSSVLHRRGLPHRAPIEKETLRQQILHLELDLDDPECQREVSEYCYSDTDGCLALFEEQTRNLVMNPATMAWWTEYEKAIARMELRGIPFAVDEYADIIDRWPEIRELLARGGEGTPEVFVNGRFDAGRFTQWYRAQGIAWPTRLSNTTGRAYTSYDDEAMKLMEGRHPVIAMVRQIKKTLTRFNRRALVVDPQTRRHYSSTVVFRSVTGRNQPKDFIFSGPKWMRYLIVPPSPDHVLVYVDYVAQEIGIAAGLSGDSQMREVYAANDCHMSFAVRAGGAPNGATKQTHPAARKKYKQVNLGVLYGQTEYGISQRLGIPRGEARTLLEDHRRLFPGFWVWSERMVQGAFDRGYITTPCGWRCRVPPYSNERTWMNWPMQSTGADIMRLTVVYLDRQGVQLLAPVHDGFLLTCTRPEIPALRAAVDYACAAAVEHVLPGFPLKWDFTVYEERFEDEDGLPLWRRLMSAMEALARA